MKIRYRLGRENGDATTWTKPLRLRFAIRRARLFLKGAEVGDRAIIRKVAVRPVVIAPSTATDAIAKVYIAVFTRYLDAESWGVFNCRYIRDTTIWSQHAWGNGLDIHFDDADKMDEVAHWLKRQANADALPISQVLWRAHDLITANEVADHFDHIHVSGKPLETGTPPCAAS